MPSSRHTFHKQLIGERLAKARTDVALTQAEAAAKLRDLVRSTWGSAASAMVYQSYIAKCELGMRRVDGWELLEFAAIYGTTIHELLRPLSTEQLEQAAAFNRSEAADARERARRRREAKKKRDAGAAR